MNVPSETDLLASIDAFLARNPGIGEARFGRDATGEPGLVNRLRRGSSPTLRIAAAITGYMQRKDAEAGHHGPTDTVSLEAASPGIATDITGAAA
ncbi:MAG: hypothetical protein OSB00_07755 [Sphingomonas bacterium]|nr:hypothetical protein [Sphingomonas bacterium]